MIKARGSTYGFPNKFIIRFIWFTTTLYLIHTKLEKFNVIVRSGSIVVVPT